MKDVLGHPIKKGCTVLTNYYSSPEMGVITTIEDVFKKTAAVTIPVRVWDYKNKTSKVEYKRLRKEPHQLIVVDQQLEYNKQNYPENLL